MPLSFCQCVLEKKKKDNVMYRCSSHVWPKMRTFKPHRHQLNFTTALFETEHFSISHINAKFPNTRTLLMSKLLNFQTVPEMLKFTRFVFKEFSITSDFIYIRCIFHIVIIRICRVSRSYKLPVYTHIHVQDFQKLNNTLSYFYIHFQSRQK